MPLSRLRQAVCDLDDPTFNFAASDSHRADERFATDPITATGVGAASATRPTEARAALCFQAERPRRLALAIA
jgi:hypothetical protein